MGHTVELAWLTGPSITCGWEGPGCHATSLLGATPSASRQEYTVSIFCCGSDWSAFRWVAPHQKKAGTLLQRMGLDIRTPLEWGSRHYELSSIRSGKGSSVSSEKRLSPGEQTSLAELSLWLALHCTIPSVASHAEFSLWPPGFSVPSTCSLLQ